MWGISEKFRLGLRLQWPISLVEVLKASVGSLAAFFEGEEALAMLSLEEAFVGDPSPEERCWLPSVPRWGSEVGSERETLDVCAVVRGNVRRLLGVPGPDGGLSLNTVLSMVSVLTHFCDLDSFAESSSPCSRISTRGDFMTGLDPQTRNELSCVVIRVQSSLDVTICSCECVCVWIID